LVAELREARLYEAMERARVALEVGRSHTRRAVARAIRRAVLEGELRGLDFAIAVRTQDGRDRIARLRRELEALDDDL